MRKAGHTMNVRRIPQHPALPATAYVALCQCGWTYEAPLRVIVDEHRARHVAIALPPKYKGFRCPCGTCFNSRRDRDAHMLECMQAPKGWAA